MTTENPTLKIKAKRLGTVKEVKQLLTDFENAYNSIYAFEFLIDTLLNDQDRRLMLLDERYHHWRRYWKKVSMTKDSPYDPLMFEFFMDSHLYRTNESLINLLELQSKIDIEKIVLPADRLAISKVNIQSPGFWEFLGSANPLQFIREFIKDLSYRNRQEKEFGELKIMQEKIATLKQLGYNDLQIKQMVSSMVAEPLRKLIKHKEDGLIDGIEE